MKKKEIKNFNEQQNKLKLKIPQPNKYYSIKKSSIYNPIVSIKLNNRQSIQNMINKKAKKSMFKDSLDENISESKTNILIPDSLNNTKNSIIIDTIRNTSNTLNNLSNNSDRMKIKQKNINENKNNKEEETKKIDYRYYTNYPIKEIFNKNKIKNIKNNDDEDEGEGEEKLYWLATYDKLMKKQKIIKILNYYYKKNKYKENDIKEKLMQIKDFDIFFPNNSNVPLIQYSKNNLIFVKLYLLTLENINIILSYINRIKININCNDIDKLITKGNYQIISDNNNFKYNIIYFMGTFLNINIYGFSNIYNDSIYNFNFNYIDNINNSLSVDNGNQKGPSSKHIAKLIKILIQNFPKFDADFFICYLLSKIKFNSYTEKSNEIKNYIYSNNTIDLHHRIINSNYLAEVAGFRASFTATSIKTPNSTGKNNIFNYKQKYNNINYNNNNDIYIQNQKGCNTDMIKYQNYNENNQIFNKFKRNKNEIGEKLNNNIIKVMSSKKEKVGENNSLYNMNMNYIKIGTIKNKSINNKKLKFNDKESSPNNIIKIQNKSNIIKKKEKLKKIYKLKSNRVNMNKSQQEKNSLFNSNKIDISKIIKNKKKKSVKKSSIYYDKKIAKMFYYKTEVQKKLFDRFNNNLSNNNKMWGTNELLNSFDLNKCIVKNNVDKKDKNKEKKIKRNIGIYVVDRRIKTDIEDEENSVILLKPSINTESNNNNNSSEEFMTPQRKKKYKYYY